MIEKGCPEYIQTIVQGPCYIWHVLDDCVDVRYASIEEAKEQKANGATRLFADHVVTVPYSAFDEAERSNLYPGAQREGLLHLMDITYAGGSTERQVMVSLRPLPPPPTAEQLQESLDWADRMLSKKYP